MHNKILLLGLLLLCQVVNAETAIVSIIIDDMGYRLRDDERALKLPGNITICSAKEQIGRFVKILSKVSHRSNRDAA